MTLPSWDASEWDVRHLWQSGQLTSADVRAWYAKHATGLAAEVARIKQASRDDYATWRDDYEECPDCKGDYRLKGHTDHYDNDRDYRWGE